MIKDKLKPDSKKPGVGKSVPCPRCNGPAEFYSANYIACPRCDSEAAPKSQADPADTKPNWVLVDLEPGRKAWYQCLACFTRQREHVDDVAAGIGCQACGGRLWVVP